jgi:hypothetical protein
MIWVMGPVMDRVKSTDDTVARVAAVAPMTMNRTTMKEARCKAT